MSQPYRSIGIGTADISATDRKRVERVLRSGRLSAGPMTRRFESLVAGVAGRTGAVFMNSGTGALQLSLQALREQRGWALGSEVIVPALTFVASINTILYAGLKPVLADVDPQTFTLDPKAITEHIGPKTVAIMAVNIAGLPADLTKIERLARRHRLALIEDSAESIGVSRDGRPVGSFGDVSCFSTYMAHILTTGVGGLAVSDDPDLLLRIRSLANHGRDPRYLTIDDDNDLSDAALAAVISARYRFVSLGQSFRATELEAALGIGQIERLKSNIRRRQHYGTMLDEIFHRDGFTPQKLPTGAETARMFYPVVAPDRKTRDRVIVALERSGVETRHLLPILGQPCYAEMGWRTADYPVAASLLERAFSIGSHQGLGAADARHIRRVLDDAIATGR
jgi:dTDP-4-amino-4,6-dideoxygalactose transaminase